MEAGVTKLNKLITVIIFLTFVLSAFLVIEPISAEETMDNIVDASFNIEMVSATDFVITCELTVSKITLSGSRATYSGEDISSFASSNLLMLGAISQELNILIDNTLSGIFQDADVVALQDLPTYESDKFNAEFNVSLTSAYFGLNEAVNAHDFINGVLDMSARLFYEFDLKAEPGWDNSYIISLGNLYDHRYIEKGFLDIIGNKITWNVANEAGNNPSLDAKLRISNKNPSTPEINDEDIFLAFKLDTRGEKTSLTTNILSKSISIEEYNTLPSFITNLTHITADGIRLFVDNGLFSWDNFNQTTIKPIEENITSNVETPIFNQTLQMIQEWDNATTINCSVPYEINNMNDVPSVKTILKDYDINLHIYDITTKAVFGLVNSGAIANVSENDINFGDSLSRIGYPYNITLFLPEGIVLEEENEFTWNDTIDFSGDFITEDPVASSKEDINTVIEIEIESTDLNLLSTFAGNAELSFGMELTENTNYNVTALPDEFDLPDKITLDHLNSDAFRLCVEEKVFTEEQIKTFLKNNKNSFQTKMKNILPGLSISGRTNRGVFDKSLAWDGDISNMDADKPLQIKSYAHSSYPVSIGFSFLPPKVDIPAHNYTLTGLPNQSVTYRLIFPQGVSISASDSLNRVELKKMKDGRQYFEVTFSAEESDLKTSVLCKMTPSALFVVSIFMPCIISFIITIILIIVIFMIRKKRKGRKTAVIVQEDSNSGYEDEEFYVPPPPRSK